ncbi:Ribbon-helix-helix protein, copG family [Ruminococcus sp. YE71]|nr:MULTISPECIES: ribbon-helix-helix domain-containing protein [unclassified Ruminococcus]SDA30341.1 Ribbon-helix-helix protein, copG family [Ruminococcus sp. YE78]SFW49464.1 Ribbon-helix-helix protein, copG family [Ruminococcus sp. YE71]
MKTEVEIPPQYVEIIEQLAKKQGVSLDEMVETVLRNYLERSRTDAG